MNDRGCTVHAEEEKREKKGTVSRLATFWKFAEVLHMAKERQTQAACLGTWRNQIPMSVSNIK